MMNISRYIITVILSVVLIGCIAILAPSNWLPWIIWILAFYKVTDGVSLVIDKLMDIEE